MAAEITRFIKRIDDAANGLLRKIGIKLPKTTEAQRAKQERLLRTLSKLAPKAAIELENISSIVTEKVIGFARDVTAEMIAAQDRVTDLVFEQAPGNKKALRLVDDIVDFPIQFYARAWLLTFDFVLEGNERVREANRRKKRRQ